MNDSNSNKDKNLFSEFPPISRNEWEEVIRKDLKGADYKEKLRWDTGEGIEVFPFYRRNDLDKTPLSGPVRSPGKNKNRWQITQPVFDKKIDKACDTAAHLLNTGSDALHFTFMIRRTDGMLGGDIKGTAIQNQKEFNTLFKEIPLDQTTVHFDSGMGSVLLQAMLRNYLEESEVRPEKVKMTFLHDPFAYILRSGQLPKPEKTFYNEFGEIINFCNNNLPGCRSLGIDARLIHKAGGTIVQEVAYALAAGNEYIAALTEQDKTLSEILPNIFFTFSSGSNFFLEIAKFRALRKLWVKIQDAYRTEQTSKDYQNHPAFIRAETSEWTKTIYDPHTNILRNTTEGMAAALAGCDSITIFPFDYLSDSPGDFSQRLAKNTQLIFTEEAYLDQVNDPSAGSYYIEILTDKIAGKAWKMFREIEKQGGLFKSVIEGSFQWEIEESAKKRNSAIANRDRIFVGTNQYPKDGEVREKSVMSTYSVESLLKSDNGNFNIDSSLNYVGELARLFRGGANLGDLVPLIMDPGKHNIRPLKPYRGAEAFEELRIATEQSELVPDVFILPIGDRKRRKERANFASNLLGCIGYHIEDHLGFDTIDEAVKELKGSKPDIVVICSSDKEYDEIIEPLCRKISESETDPYIIMAGSPGDNEHRYRRAGVDEFIYSGMNILETLQKFQEKFGIT